MGFGVLGGLRFGLEYSALALKTLITINIV